METALVTAIEKATRDAIAVADAAWGINKIAERAAKAAREVMQLALELQCNSLKSLYCAQCGTELPDDRRDYGLCYLCHAME